MAYFTYMGLLTMVGHIMQALRVTTSSLRAWMEYIDFSEFDIDEIVLIRAFQRAIKWKVNNSSTYHLAHAWSEIDVYHEDHQDPVHHAIAC